MSQFRHYRSIDLLDSKLKGTAEPISDALKRCSVYPPFCASSSKLRVHGTNILSHQRFQVTGKLSSQRVRSHNNGVQFFAS